MKIKALIHAVKEHDAKIREYLTTHKRNYLTKEESLLLNPHNITNVDRSRVEKFLTYYNCPDKLFMYHKKVMLNEKGYQRIVTTWTGEKLGQIAWTYPPYYSNFGDKRERCHALINHVWYTGIITSAGDYIRLRKLKYNTLNNKPQKQEKKESTI